MHNRPRIGQLHHLAQIHDHDAAADVFDHGKVVADEQISKPARGLQVLQQVDDLRLYRNVQRADRLIADHQPRLHCQCPRDANPLPLTAAEFVGIPLRVRRVQTHRLDQLPDPFLTGFGIRRQFVDIERLADGFADGHARIQRAIRILKNHLQLAPPRAQLRAFEFRELFALKENAAGSRLDETHNRAAQRCLAAAALAHQPQGFARLHRETHVVHCLDELFRARKQPVHHRKANFEVPDFEQLAGLETSRLRFAIFRRSIHKSQNGHRTHRCGSTSSSAGIFCEQSGRAFAHRG